MKKLIMFVAVFFILQAVAVASPKNIDLREYQQATGTINVLAAPYQDSTFYLATFNFDEKNKGNDLDYYQGTCIVGGKDKEVLQPLSVKKISGTEKNVKESIINKNKQMPYLQQARVVQTNSVEPKQYVGGDATDVVFLGKFKVTTKAGVFDDCIGIKIYNKDTGEGMIQYLAKGCGVVYMEGVKADGTKTEIAHLAEIRALDNTQVENFKTKYFG